MQFVIVLLIAAAVFGVCYLVDKGFSKAFRGKAQHRSGMAVRANKRFGVFGVVLTVLGVMAFCIGIGDGPVLIVGGLIVFAMGIFLAVYYLSFGIFYDGESFLMSQFGKKDAVHRYEEIVGQKLYVVQHRGGAVPEGRLHCQSAIHHGRRVSLPGHRLCRLVPPDGARP